MEYVVNIASDFSTYPGGRFATDGKYSGQEFRDTFLLPRLQEGHSVRVQLDGTRGYSSCFLEEVFGGIVRAGIEEAEIRNKVILETQRDSLKREIEEYIVKAFEDEKIARLARQRFFASYNA